MHRVKDVLAKSRRSAIINYILIIACGLLFPIRSWAMGLGVDPGEFYLHNVALGQKVAVSSLSRDGMKLRIKNKGRTAYAYTINILSTSQTTATLGQGYIDIPDTAWIFPESKELRVPGNSTKDVELYLMIPKKEEYYNKNYQAVIEVKSKKNKAEELFVLACQLKISFSTYPSAQSQDLAKYPQNITIVKTNDKWAENPSFLSWLRTEFPYSNIKQLDYSTKAGRGLVKALRLSVLPAYIFSEDIEKYEKFNGRVERGQFRDNNGNYLWSGSRQNSIFIKRPRAPHTLEVFSVSNDPTSRKLVDAIITAKAAGGIPKSFKLDWHYLASTLPAEREEDIRQLCIKKYSPTKFLDYLLLRNKNIQDQNWEKQAKDAGVDVSTISECILKEGELLLKEDIKKAQGLGLRTAPALLYENRILIVSPCDVKELPGLEKLEIDNCDSCSK